MIGKVHIRDVHQATDDWSFREKAQRQLQKWSCMELLRLTDLWGKGGTRTSGMTPVTKTQTKHELSLPMWGCHTFIYKTTEVNNKQQSVGSVVLRLQKNSVHLLWFVWKDPIHGDKQLTFSNKYLPQHLWIWYQWVSSFSASSKIYHHQNPPEIPVCFTIQIHQHRTLLKLLSVLQFI